MRTRRSLLNFATMILYTGVVMAAGLFASPWLERWLGAGPFGGYRVILGIYGYLGLLELGLGGALSPLLARAIGRGDEAELGRIVAAGVRAYFRVSLRMVAVGLVLTPLVPWFAADLPLSGVGDLRRAWLVVLLAPLLFALSPFRAIVEARQQGYRINLLLAAQSLLITALALALARSGWGIAGQSLAMVVGIFAFNLALAGLVVGREPHLLRAALAGPTDPSAKRALWALSVPTLALSLCGRLSLLTDDLVIGGLLGGTAVTTLFFTQRLAVMAQTLLQGVGGATWAALAELHARGERETFNRRLIELTRLTGVLGAAVLAPIAAYNHHFFRLWVKQELAYGGDAVIICAALNAYLQAQTSLWGWCFGATGQVRRVVPQAAVWAVVNLSASVVLTRALGVVGPLLGSTVAYVAVSVWLFPRLLRDAFGTPPAALADAFARPLLGGAVYAGLLWWVAHLHRPFGWLGLAAEMSAAALGFLALSLVVIFDRDDRALWLGRLGALRT